MDTPPVRDVYEQLHYRNCPSLGTLFVRQYAAVGDVQIWSGSFEARNPMLRVHSEVFESKKLRAMGLLAGLFTLTWMLSNWIVSGSFTYLILTAVAGVGFLTMIYVLKDWRSGVFIFLVWLVFEDLVRKFTGNSLFMFFGKDILIGLTYVSMLIALRQRRLLLFKPPFLFWLAVFFWVGVVQLFNPNSPSIFYGLLGIKTYFYYVPLMFAGYALLRSEADLHKILILNMWIALVVAGLGVIQTFGGGKFLTPTDIAPELYVLSHNFKESPVTHLLSLRPTSVFVSEGRFGLFNALMFMMAFGTAGYLMMRGKRGRTVAFCAVGVVVLATVMGASRGAFVQMIVGAVALGGALLWGGSWRKRQIIRLGGAIMVIAVVVAIGIFAATAFFPDAINARWALYAETLSPTSSSSELSLRAWEYPEMEIESVFRQQNWKWGNGIGVASLGAQYVYKLTGAPVLHIGAETGYGLLILEFGIIGPFLWTVWTVSLLIAAWKVVRKLRRTPFFPIGFAIFLSAFILLGPSTFYGLNGYQNYLTCAYLWLTVGMLFRLPGLLAEQQAAIAAVSHAQTS
jgi:hypothetical protein